MKIKLPMVLNLKDEEQRSYYIALNQFIQFDENEKNIVDMAMINETGIRTLGDDTVGMLKIGSDFRNYGSNGSVSSDYVYFFNTSIKFNNEDIVKKFLENHRGEFKSINSVDKYMKDTLYTRYRQNVDIDKIIQELEVNEPFLNFSKAKMKI